MAGRFLGATVAVVRKKRPLREAFYTRFGNDI